MTMSVKDLEKMLAEAKKAERTQALRSLAEVEELEAARVAVRKQNKTKLTKASLLDVYAKVIYDMDANASDLTLGDLAEAGKSDFMVKLVQDADARKRLAELAEFYPSSEPINLCMDVQKAAKPLVDLLHVDELTDEEVEKQAVAKVERANSAAVRECTLAKKYAKMRLF